MKNEGEAGNEVYTDDGNLPAGYRFGKIPKDEQAIIKEFEGGIAWPTIGMAGGLVAGWVALVYDGLKDKPRVPKWTAVALQSYMVHAMYMPMHEAEHGNVAGKGNLKMRWLDDLVGNAMGFMMMFGFTGHRIHHHLHHAYTNMKNGMDPDLWTEGPLLGVPLKITILLSALNLVSLLPSETGADFAIAAQSWETKYKYGNTVDVNSFAMKRMHKGYKLIMRDHKVFMLAALMLSLTTKNGFRAAFWRWWLPAQIGKALMAIIFAWAPHYDFDKIGRYEDTRVYLLDPKERSLLHRMYTFFLAFGHNYHAVHHLYPRVSMFKYLPLYRKLHTVLKEKRVRLEGTEENPNIVWRWI